VLLLLCGNRTMIQWTWNWTVSLSASLSNRTLLILMSLLMSSEIATLRESSLTFFAFVGSLSSMSSHVNLQSTGPHELVVALSTDIRSLPWVLSLVVSQVSLSGETHITVSIIAFEGFLAVVDSHMCEQITLFPECFFTTFDLAYKRSFTSL
jgi:hypothetical protein